MLSPFPGMDPYLEGELWTTVHSQLAAEIARQLAPKIAPRYVARTEKRFVITAPDDLDEAEISIYTDVGVRTVKARQRRKEPLLEQWLRRRWLWRLSWKRKPRTTGWKSGMPSAERL